MRALAALAAGLLALTPSLTEADPRAVALGFHSLCGDPDAGGGAAAPAARLLLSGYGTGGFVIATKNPKAQAFFNNGMQLSHAFAHDDAAAAFQEAERLDPACAMCVWGEAWSRGPTINYTVNDAKQKELAVLAAKAAELARNGPPLEQALTAALVKRYDHGGGAGLGDLAFAQAMDDLVNSRPDDNEVAILTADAWMIPASLRNTQDNLPHARDLVEGALKRNPDDTGAIHFYIHVTEMTGVGFKALPYASRLGALTPSASHLTHMPSHTYYWVGQYLDAAHANVEAVALDRADARRQGLDPASGAWKQFYHGHNVQFGVGGALMANDADDALSLAEPVIAMIPGLKPEQAWPQMGAATALFAQGRFADPAKVMVLSDPGPRLPFVRAMWRYARGEAAARLGDAKAVRAEAAQVRIDGAGLKPFGEYGSQGDGMVQVARLVLLGRAFMLENNPAEAAKAYRKAAEIQEARFTLFTDPPAWWFPVRRSLAAALLRAGKADEAIVEARAVLDKWPKDAMSLTVLGEAEMSLGKAAEANVHFAEARMGWVGDLTRVTLASI
jgi:tetratricopeptide (TPR) repeat protein